MDFRRVHDTAFFFSFLSVIAIMQICKHVMAKGRFGSISKLNMFWFDFCFTPLQHILGRFGGGQLP